METTNDLNNTAAERIRLEKLGAELAAKAVKLSEALKYAQIQPGQLQEGSARRPFGLGHRRSASQRRGDFARR